MKSNLKLKDKNVLHIRRFEPKDHFPEHLNTPRKRREHIRAVASLTPEEQRKKAKEIDKQLRFDVHTWTTSLEKAAYYIAENRMSMQQVSDKTGIPLSRLNKYLSIENGNFATVVEKYRDEIMKKIKTIGIANKNVRIGVLNDLHERLLSVIYDRAAKYENDKRPGVRAGIMVRTVKAVGHGHTTKIVRGWDVDKDLIREIRDLEVQAAKEAGQWSEKVENSNTVLVREYAGADTSLV